MKRFVCAMFGIVAVGCFGKIAPQPSDGGDVDGSFGDGGDGGDDGGDGGTLLPVPNCTATSVCLAGFNGAVEVVCDPAPIRGPWPLVLERQVLNDWRVVLTKKVDSPGFGVTFDDTNAPKVAHLLYHVCVVDDNGERCGPTLETISPPVCGPCVPFTCIDFRACDTDVSNGCGGTITCGHCPPGETCSKTYQSCCPPGTEPDGEGGCQCAPPHRCPPRYYWEAAHCMCAPLFKPDPLPL